MRERRQKASDVFRDANLVFASKTNNFSEAFPKIKDFEIKVTEVGRGTSYSIGDREKTATYNMNHAPGEYIDCSNSLCYNGGFSIGNILRNMQHDNQEEYEEEFIFCRGYEGSPKGRRRYGPCSNYFNVKAKVTYHPDPAD